MRVNADAAATQRGWQGACVRACAQARALCGGSSGSSGDDTCYANPCSGSGGEKGRGQALRCLHSLIISVTVTLSLVH